MTQVKAYVPGLGPRSANHTEQDLEAELQDFLSVQRESGMDYFSDGLLGWPDLAAPLARRVERAPTRERGALATGATCQPLGETYFRASEMPWGRWISTLPSPLALSQATGVSARAATEAALSPQLGWLAGNGCAFAVLQNTQMPDAAEVAALGEALEAAESPLPLVLRLPPGDAVSVIAGIVDLPVEAIGLDMVSTGAEALPEPFPKTLLAGAVDAANPEPEEPSRLAARYEDLLDRLDGEADLHLAPNGDLRTLAPEAAARKIRSLGDAARILRGG